MSTLIIEQLPNVVHISLNRPAALNALNKELMLEMVETLERFDMSEEVGAFVISGSPKAFAAGADIKEMKDENFSTMYMENWFAGWDRLTRIRTPIIAAVSGFALGGGCELASMCDMIIASKSAKFGQPEIKLGIIPGMGGSQRFTRAVGKAKAMDMILTGRMMDAEEAEKAGLVARIVEDDELIEKALEIATDIANFSPLAGRAAKEAVNRAFEMSLNEGILFERRQFHALFGTEDQKEGMNAFIEKRQAEFKGR